MSYRLRQFWHLWTAAPLLQTAYDEISAVLSQDECKLFALFQISDQWHSYRVYQTLRAAGHAHPDLLAAALLHDVGKTKVPLSIWERVLIVITQALYPRQMRRWGEGNAQGWRRAFVVKACHPIWGAEMAQAAGSHDLTVALIRRHQDPLPATAVTEEDRLLQYLQWADNQN